MSVRSEPGMGKNHHPEAVGSGLATLRCIGHWFSIGYWFIVHGLLLLLLYNCSYGTSVQKLQGLDWKELEATVSNPAVGVALSRSAGFAIDGSPPSDSDPRLIGLAPTPVPLPAFAPFSPPS